MSNADLLEHFDVHIGVSHNGSTDGGTQQRFESEIIAPGLHKKDSERYPSLSQPFISSQLLGYVYHSAFHRQTY